MSDKTNQQQKSLTRSSTAEYLSYIAAHGEGGVEAMYVDENIWLSQKMIGVLFTQDSLFMSYFDKQISKMMDKKDK